MAVCLFSVHVGSLPKCVYFKMSSWKVVVELRKQNEQLNWGYLKYSRKVAVFGTARLISRLHWVNTKLCQWHRKILAISSHLTGSSWLWNDEAFHLLAGFLALLAKLISKPVKKRHSFLALMETDPTNFSRWWGRFCVCIQPSCFYHLLLHRLARHWR